MAEGWSNRFDDCIYQWEDDYGKPIPVIILLPADWPQAYTEAPPRAEVEFMGLRLVQEGEYVPKPAPRQVRVERPVLFMSMADAAEMAAAIMRQVERGIELNAGRADVRLLGRVRGALWTCQKIESELTKKK